MIPNSTYIDINKTIKAYQNQHSQEHRENQIQARPGKQAKDKVADKGRSAYYTSLQKEIKQQEDGLKNNTNAYFY